MRTLGYKVIDWALDATLNVYLVFGGLALTTVLTAVAAWFKLRSFVEVYFLAWACLILWPLLLAAIIVAAYVARRCTTYRDYRAIEWLSSVVERETIGNWWQLAWTTKGQTQEFHEAYGRWKNETICPEMEKHLGVNFANEYRSIGDLEDWIRLPDTATIQAIIRRDMKFLRAFISEWNKALVFPLGYSSRFRN